MKRVLRRVHAWLFGYFWLPCPVCGEWFGGHEATGDMLVPYPGAERGRCICPRHGGDVYERDAA